MTVTTSFFSKNDKKLKLSCLFVNKVGKQRCQIFSAKASVSVTQFWRFLLLETKLVVSECFGRTEFCFRVQKRPTSLRFFFLSKNEWWTSKAIIYLDFRIRRKFLLILGLRLYLLQSGDCLFWQYVLCTSSVAYYIRLSTY